jgi:hypothetical protein
VPSEARVRPDFGPGRERFSVLRLAAWQSALILVLVSLSIASGRGSAWSVAGGGALLYGSLLLQRLALSMALRPGKGRTPLAIGLFLLKLLLLLGVALWGLRTAAVAPMSFAAGASTLLLAILIETWYGNRAPLERQRFPRPEGRPSS